VRDRLYLTEDYHFDRGDLDLDSGWFADLAEVTKERAKEYSEEMGRRIFVMSLTGEVLQIYALALGPGRRFDDVMAVFGENLVLRPNFDTPELITLEGI
jgi:hypothetical protein